MAVPINAQLQKETKLFDQTEIRLGLNVADKIDDAKQSKIWVYMLDHYIRPQMDARRSYEKMWDLLYNAYRMRLKISDMKLREDEAAFVDILKQRMAASGNEDMILTDSLIFDTVDRLSNLTHYISWKEGKPVQFGTPEDFKSPLEDMMYSPTDEKNKAQNAVLSWAFEKEDAYDKSREADRDYYLYGFGYMISDLYFRVAQKGDAVVLQDIGISYQPTSVRKVWIDWRIPISKMDDQPCPFWFDMVPIFKVMGSPYEPTFNPMGYVNLDKAYQNCHNTTTNFFIGGESYREAIKGRLESGGFGSIPESQYNKIKAKWTFYPMLPFDDKTGEFEYRNDEKGNPDTSKPIPFQRFVVEVFGEDLVSNKVVMIRCQNVENHYETKLPIYGGSHLSDLSSAAYSMSICEALINAAIELTFNINLTLENKNLINNPPTQHLVGSPSLTVDVWRPRAKVEVFSQGDFDWRQVPDATQSTMMIDAGIRDRAQTTGRVTESILGKAAGGRTTAEEAGNIFETSMSQITTDINILNKARNGGFAERVFIAICKWLDPDLIKLITGSYGWPISEIDRALKISLRTNVGTRYLTSVLQEKKVQFMLGAAVQSPVLDQAILWQQYAQLSGMPQLQKAVIDGGRDREIARAYDQAVKTYLNEAVVIDPAQNHDIAMQVKIRFIEDTDSEWNKKYGPLPYMMTPHPRLMALSAQVQIHQQYLLMQQQQAAQLQAQQASMMIRDQGYQAQAAAAAEQAKAKQKSAV